MGLLFYFVHFLKTQTFEGLVEVPALSLKIIL